MLFTGSPPIVVIETRFFVSAWDSSAGLDGADQPIIIITQFC